MKKFKQECKRSFAEATQKKVENHQALNDDDIK